MLKTHGHRRLALLLALVFVTSLLAACSSSQSSTDEPLSHPGKDYVGTIRMDIDPSNEKIEITKLDDAVTNNILTKVSGFLVSTPVPPTFAGDTLTGNIVFKWTGPERLEDVSIRVFSADATGLLAKIDNADTCAGQPIGTCIGGGGTEGIVYVGDEETDGPETEFECLGTYPACTPGQARGLRLMSPGCTATTIAGNSVTAKWSMTETTGGHPKYTFMAHVYGSKVPALLKDDPRYDADVATVNMKAYAPDHLTQFPVVNTARPLTYVKTGQWFYVLSYIDAPGDKSRGQVAKMCDDGDGNTTCSIVPALADAYDFYYIEDQANYNAISANPSWNKYASYNTGYMFPGSASWMIQWDPAVLQCNDMSQGIGTIFGSGVQTFRTKGTTGTKMYAYSDTNITDQWKDDGTLPSGWANRCLTAYAGNWSYPPATLIPPSLADWLDVDDYGTGITQGDFPSGIVALKAIGPSGSGAPIRISPSGNTTYVVTIGNKAGDPNFASNSVTQKSNNYPIWAYATGVNEGPGGSIGHYNEQIAWICVQ